MLILGAVGLQIRLSGVGLQIQPSEEKKVQP